MILSKHQQPPPPQYPTTKRATSHGDALLPPSARVT